MKGILYTVTGIMILLQTTISWSQSYYWISFTDKAGTPYSLAFPEDYLSERSIERRERQHIAIDSLDLPVNPSYIEQVLALNAILVHSSKWLNGITVRTGDENFAEKVLQLDFVKEAELTKQPTYTKSASDKFIDPLSVGKLLEIDTVRYGSSASQVSQLNGQYLHNQGFKGQNMHIAVLDAGFYKADQYPAFDSLWYDGRVLGTKDFVNPFMNIYDGHYHGMSVLSIMAGNNPGELIGTAPKASYWLIRTEDISSEYLIEEDNWIAGAEFADSVGCDIINSSLGYFIFDDSTMNHIYSEMDGHTARVTRGANIAMSRGILVFASAGNEGNKDDEWKYIIAPSDGDSVIGVGAVNKEGVTAPFTSYGPSSDGDVKPNVSAMGWNTVIQRSNGTFGTGNGTSYSSPVIAGTAACLWQANPFATAYQVKEALEKSAHLYNNPDSLLGYGIPDMMIADQILKATVIDQWEDHAEWLLYPNPASDYIILQKHNKADFGSVQLTFYSIDGKILRQETRPDASKIILRNLSSLKQGMLFLQICSDDLTETKKIRKIP
jgi:serine protease AprX